MPVTDPIADYLTRVRNAQRNHHRWVDIPASNLKKRLSLILKHEHFIKDFLIIEDGQQDKLRVYLKYDRDGNAVIEGLKRASKPGRRYYTPASNIPRVLGGLGITILSTPMGFSQINLHESTI